MQTDTKHAAFWPILVALIGVTAAVFFPVLTFESTNYDDPNYVFENPPVLGGLTGAGVKWAFTTGHAANWHPITWLSHMTDVELFGRKTGAHHGVSLVLHCVNVGLVFALICKLTGALWRSAFVAALFAIHPLHVESVAWISERKDVLSALFGLLTLLAYTQFAQALPDQKAKRKLSYTFALVLFALGLMSKPMLVSLPLIMLLLDLWPLKRTTFALCTNSLRQLFIEKIPFVVLAAASCVATLMVQGRGGAVRSLETLSLFDRLANAAIACVLYLGKIFWPAKLAAFYPMPADYSLLNVTGAVVVLIGVSVWVLFSATRAPHRLVGWFWFLIMLAPVIGVVHVGMQQMADRYTYLPLIGFSILVTWEGTMLMSRSPAGKPIAIAAAILVVVACAAKTRNQVLVWRNSETLFRHALAVTEKNYLAHNNLGYHFFTQGKINEAIAEYQAAIAVNPGYTDAHSNLGRTLASQGRYPEAVGHLEAVLRVLPNDVIAHNNLGNTLAILGRHEEAIEHFRAALAVKPDHTAAHNNWALSALELGRAGEAIEHFRSALQLKPDFVEAMSNLAWLLATNPDANLRNGAEALQLAEAACRLTHYDQPLPLLIFAAASAETGRWEEAVSLATRATEIAAARSDPDLRQNCELVLTTVKAGRPYRQPLRTDQ